MKRIAHLLLPGMLLLGVSACSLFGTEEPMYTSGTIDETFATVTAKVAAIDHASRSVSLLTNEGLSINFVAGPDVRNLDQVEAGDLVRVTYYESVAYELRKPGEGTPGAQMAEEVGRAEAGAKPGVGAARMVQITATVKAIDKKKPSVTLETADGQRRMILVRNPDRLIGVKVGDLVEFTLTQAVAVGVEEVDN